MATIRTRSLTRKKIAELVGNGNQELIKFIEDLTDDVRVSIPDAIEETTAGDAQAIISASTFLPRTSTMPTSVSEAQSVHAMAAFLPSQTSLPRADADSQSVLAGQIFGA